MNSYLPLRAAQRAVRRQGRPPLAVDLMAFDGPDAATLPTIPIPDVVLAAGRADDDRYGPKESRAYCSLIPSGCLCLPQSNDCNGRTICQGSRQELGCDLERSLPSEFTRMTDKRPLASSRPAATAQCRRPHTHGRHLGLPSRSCNAPPLPSAHTSAFRRRRQSQGGLAVRRRFVVGHARHGFPWRGRGCQGSPSRECQSPKSLGRQCRR